MKAIFYSKYGAPDQLQLKEVEKPTSGDNEVLVEIHAATVTVGDVYTVKGEPFLTRVLRLSKQKCAIANTCMIKRNI